MATIPKPIAISLLLGASLIVAAVVMKVSQSPGAGPSATPVSAADASPSLAAAAKANRSARLLALATESAKAGNFTEAEQRRDEALSNSADRTAVEAVTALIAAERSAYQARGASQESQQRARTAQREAEQAASEARSTARGIQDDNAREANKPKWRVIYKGDKSGTIKTFTVRAADSHEAFLLTQRDALADYSEPWTWQLTKPAF